MEKFKVLKKEFANFNGTICEGVDTEVVEACFYDTPDGCLIFYGEGDTHIKTFAPGVWLEIETVI